MTTAVQHDADARLGRAIRGVRRGRGLTLAQVADAAGLSQPFLSQLELGRSRPSMRSLFRIAEALGTTQQALLAMATTSARHWSSTVEGVSVREDLTGNPMDVLARWVADAAAAGLPSTMTLATADTDGAPHARTVLVTVIDAGSLRFHSSTPTTKTRDLAANPRVSGVFYWPALGRQAVLHGTAGELDPAVSRAAYPTRPRSLQRVAWVYETLTPAGPDFAVPPGAVDSAFGAARDAVDMPPSWTTIELAPARIDFWQAGTDDVPPSRTRFVAEDTGWRSFPVLP